jgi:hypothetical protein
VWCEGDDARLATVLADQAEAEQVVGQLPGVHGAHRADALAVVVANAIRLPRKETGPASNEGLLSIGSARFQIFRWSPGPMRMCQVPLVCSSRAVKRAS